MHNDAAPLYTLTFAGTVSHFSGPDAARRVTQHAERVARANRAAITEAKRAGVHAIAKGLSLVIARNGVPVRTIAL